MEFTASSAGSASEGACAKAGNRQSSGDCENGTIDVAYREANICACFLVTEKSFKSTN